MGLPKGASLGVSGSSTATAQETYQYLSSDSVYLDYESGMSILAVAKEGEEFQYFYLDKPVCAIPGYGLLSLSSRTAALSIGWLAAPAGLRRSL